MLRRWHRVAAVLAMMATMPLLACEDMKIRAQPGLSVNIDHVRHADLMTVFLTVQQFGKKPASFRADGIAVIDQNGKRYYPVSRRGALAGNELPVGPAQKAELVFDLQGESLAQTLELR